jgi:DNA-binding beta-propeller fold protein YncE
MRLFLSAVRAAALAIPMLAALPAAAGLAVVLNSGEDTISLIDTDTYKETARRPIGREPHHLMRTPDGRDLIIGNAVGNDLVFVNPATGEVMKRVDQIADPYQLGFTPDRKWFVTAALRLDRVDVYDARAIGDRKLEVVKRIPIRSMPSHLAFAADSRRVFTTLQDAGEAAAIDIIDGKILWQTKVGPEPAGIWIDAKNERLLMGIMGSDHVAVVGTKDGKVLDRIVVGKGAHQVYEDKARGLLYVSSRVDNTITALDRDSLKVVRTYKVGPGPDCMEIGRGGKELWYTARWAKRVEVLDLDTGKVIKKITVGRSPHGIHLYPDAKTASR